MTYQRKGSSSSQPVPSKWSDIFTAWFPTTWSLSIKRSELKFFHLWKEKQQSFEPRILFSSQDPKVIALEKCRSSLWAHISFLDQEFSQLNFQAHRDHKILKTVGPSHPEIFLFHSQIITIPDQSVLTHRLDDPYIISITLVNFSPDDLLLHSPYHHPSFSRAVAHFRKSKGKDQETVKKFLPNYLSDFLRFVNFPKQVINHQDYITQFPTSSHALSHHHLHDQVLSDHEKSLFEEFFKKLRTSPHHWQDGGGKIKKSHQETTTVLIMQESLLTLRKLLIYVINRIPTKSIECPFDILTKNGQTYQCTSFSFHMVMGKDQYAEFDFHQKVILAKDVIKYKTICIKDFSWLIPIDPQTYGRLLYPSHQEKSYLPSLITLPSLPQKPFQEIILDEQLSHSIISTYLQRFPDDHSYESLNKILAPFRHQPLSLFLHNQRSIATELHVHLFYYAYQFVSSLWGHQFTKILTLPQLTHSVFLNFFYSRPYRKFTIYSLPSIDHTYHYLKTLSRILGTYDQTANYTLKSLIQYWEALKHAFFPGHTAVFQHHVPKGYFYDCNSLYPYVMSQKDLFFPTGIPTRWTGEKLEDGKKCFGILYVHVKAPALFRPILPYRDSRHEGIHYYPQNGTWYGWYFSEELLYAKQKGYEIQILDGYLYQPVSGKTIFGSFVEYLFQLKSISQDEFTQSLALHYHVPSSLLHQQSLSAVQDFTRSLHFLQRQLSKLMMNSLYGKVSHYQKYDQLQIQTNSSKSEVLQSQSRATPLSPTSKITLQAPLCHQKLSEDTLFKILDFLGTFDPGKSGTSLPIGVAITAYARLYMFQTFFHRPDLQVAYMDTDSVITDKPIPSHMIHSSKLGKFKNVIQKSLFQNLSQQDQKQWHQCISKCSDSDFFLTQAYFNGPRSYTYKASYPTQLGLHISPRYEAISHLGPLSPMDRQRFHQIACHLWKAYTTNHFTLPSLQKDLPSFLSHSILAGQKMTPYFQKIQIHLSHHPESGKSKVAHDNILYPLMFLKQLHHLRTLIQLLHPTLTNHSPIPISLQLYGPLTFTSGSIDHSRGSGTYPLQLKILKQKRLSLLPSPDTQHELQNISLQYQDLQHPLTVFHTHPFTPPKEQQEEEEEEEDS